MPRSVEASLSEIPGLGDRRAWRHFGDGYAGQIVAARLQAYNSTTLAYEDVALDNATGGIITTGGASGGGGAVTVADGADVAQGTTTDVAWVSGSGTLVAISKAEFAKLEAIRALLAGTLTVNVGLTDTQLRASAVPVSLASVPSHAVTAADTTFGATVAPKAASVWDVADRSARLVGHVTVDNASIPVTGTFFQATQPVSLATNTPDVTDRAARLLGHVTVDNASLAITAAALPLPTGAATSASQSTVKAASTVAAATDTSQVVQQSPMRADAANLCVTNTAATGVACTLTIPSAGAGLFHYISLIEIQLYATAARTGGATPVLVTTTNLPGSPVWDFDTAQAIGATIRQTTQPATPIKSSVAATATTIVAPIATTGIWRITAYYYAAP